MDPTLILHIAAGTVAVTAGYVALFSRKGAWTHRAIGTVFVYAIIVAGLTVAPVALQRSKEGWFSGMIAVYLVITAVTTLRERSVRIRRLDGALSLVGLSIAVLFTASGIKGLSKAGGIASNPDVLMAFVIGGVAFLAAASDLTVLGSSPMRPNRRLRRHLWRMCFAMYTATASFFLGQADAIPAALRYWPVLITAAFLPLPVMFFWLWRVGASRARPVYTTPPLAPVVSIG
jgi:uncharacterized membrane protein